MATTVNDKDQLGISVGVKGIGGTNWYRAHSISRRPRDGAMIAFGLDDQRTPYAIPAAKFRGVSPGLRQCFSQELNDDMVGNVWMEQYKV